MTHSIIGATARHTRLVGMERRLAAILSADVQGYSRLMYEDETATIRTLTAYRGLMASLIRQYRGRVVDDPGDNLLAEFPSVVEAVQCAVTIQRTLAARNAALPPHRQMVFRMGLHLGDIVVEQERSTGRRSTWRRAWSAWLKVAVSVFRALYMTTSWPSSTWTIVR